MSASSLRAGQPVDPGRHIPIVTRFGLQLQEHCQRPGHLAHFVQASSQLVEDGTTLVHSWRLRLSGALEAVDRLGGLSAIPVQPAEERQRFVATIHGESLRLTRLLDEILDLSALERGERGWQNEPIDAEAALDRAVEVCNGFARQRNTRLALGRRASEARVLGEADRLCQVLINLISNAIKFNESDDPVVSVSSYAEGASHVIEIEDNGPGISLTDRKRIFEKFWRGRNAASGGHAGTGLGLAISRRIIARMNGSLELVPRRGRGACFRIVLPLAG